MRITGGRARGINLKVGHSSSIRPATDMLRAGLFSSIAEHVEDRVFLDLFAGTGAYGLEAMSRGAAAGHFIEKDRKTAAVLTDNLFAVAKSGEVDAAPFRVHVKDVFRWQPAEGQSFGLIFCDPPYPKIPAFHKEVFERVKLWLDVSDPLARFIFEMPAELEYKPVGWMLLKRLGSGGRGSPTLCIYAHDGIGNGE